MAPRIVPHAPAFREIGDAANGRRRAEQARRRIIDRVGRALPKLKALGGLADCAD